MKVRKTCDLKDFNEVIGIFLEKNILDKYYYCKYCIFVAFMEGIFKITYRHLLHAERYVLQGECGVTQECMMWLLYFCFLC